MEKAELLPQRQGPPWMELLEFEHLTAMLLLETSRYYGIFPLFCSLCFASNVLCELCP